MIRRLTRTETSLAIASLVVALGGGIYLSKASLHAQGPGFGGPDGRGGPGMGRMGGPGGPHGDQGGPGRRGSGGPGPGGRGGMLRGLGLGRVDLSEAQRDQVKQVLDSHKDEQLAIGEKGRLAHDALEAAITADPFDENLVRARASDLAAVDADATVFHARIRNEVYQILTSDQKAELKKDQARMMKRRAEMEERRKQ